MLFFLVPEGERPAYREPGGIRPALAYSRRDACDDDHYKNRAYGHTADEFFDLALKDIRKDSDRPGIKGLKNLVPAK